MLNIVIQIFASYPWVLGSPLWVINLVKSHTGDRRKCIRCLGGRVHRGMRPHPAEVRSQASGLFICPQIHVLALTAASDAVRTIRVVRTSYDRLLLNPVPPPPL